MNFEISRPGNIVLQLKQLVASERKITAQIVELIQEIELKKVYAHMGYSSLFSFLTEHIGYSAASAQRRIEASRLFTSVPEVKNDLKSGSLNLSQVSLVAQSLRQKQKEVPEVKINTEDKRALLSSIKNKSFEDSQKIISQTLDLEIKALDRKVIQKNDSVRIEVTFTKEQMELFNRVKNLMSHTNPGATVADVFEYLANDCLKRRDPLREVRNVSGTKNGVKLQTTSEAEVENPVLRKRLPTAIKRLVWQRDHGKCQHLNSSTGKKCGSPYLLEIDHIKRVRHGGGNDPENLRLLCHSHNLLRG